MTLTRHLVVFVALAVLLGGAASAADALLDMPVDAKIAAAEAKWGSGDFEGAADGFAGAALSASELASQIARDGQEPGHWLWARAEYCLVQATELSEGTAASGRVAAVLQKMSAMKLPGDLAARTAWSRVRLLRRTGDLKGAAKAAAALGFIASWQVIGPFENERGSGVDVAYGPEKEAARTDLAAEYDGKKRLVKWRPVPARSSDGYVDLDAMLRPNDECLAYAVTFVKAPADRTAALRIATDDGVKAWVNDALVLSANVHRPCTFDQDAVGIHLRRGWNKLLLKVTDQKLDWGFRVRITSTDGAPVRGLSYRADRAVDFDPAKAGAPRAALSPGAVESLVAELGGIYPARGGKALSLNSSKDGFWEALEKASGVKVGPAERASKARLALEAIIAKKPLAQWTELLGAYISVPDAAVVASKHHTVGTIFRHGWAHDVEKHPDREAFARALEYAPESALYRYSFSQVATDRAVMAAERDENRARTALEEAIRLDPKLAIAQMALGRYYMSNFRNTERALAYYDAALAASPGCATARLGRAAVLGARQWGSEREAIIRSVAKDSPGNAHAMEALAGVEYGRGNLPAGAAAHEAALKLVFDDPTDGIRRRLGETYVQMGKSYKAIELTDQKLRLNPFDARARFARAKLHAAADEFPQAIRECAAAIVIAPEDHEVIAQLGHYYARYGKRPKAEKLWKKALTLQPNFVSLDRYLQFVSGKTGYDVRYATDIAPLVAHARALKPADNDPYAVVLDKTIERVYRDGTSSRTVHSLVKIFNERGAQANQGRSMPYIVGEQRVKVKVARVHRADGKIDEAKISVGSQGVKRNYSTWSRAYVSMPPLKAGDIVEIEFKVDDIQQSFFGDYFGSMQRFQSGVPIVRGSYVLIVPPERPVHYHLAGGAKEPNASQDDELGAKVYTWNYENVPKLKVDPGMPNAREVVPLVYVSTYRDWTDFGKWYWDLIKDQYQMTDEMKTKVAELTKGCKNDEARIRAIYNFVVSDIRYVAWEFGVHGFKPYRASQIFDRKFGDCKDKATLINAMLRHIGIKALPVLIRGEVPRSEQDMALPMIQHFNHCISYVPAGKDYPEMYLDGTAIYHAADTLPIMDEGAKVCIVRKGGAEVKTIPPTGSDHNASHEKVSVKLGVPGKADAAVTVGAKLTGSRTPIIRQYLNIPDRRKLVIERLYGRSYAGAQCGPNIFFSDLADLEVPVTFSYTLALPNFLRPDGKRWKMRPVKGFLRGALGALFPAKFSQLASADKRDHDLLLPQAWGFTADQTYELPKGMKVITLPEASKIKTKFGSLAISYVAENGKISVKKKLTIDVVRVSKDEYPDFRRFCNEVDEHERREVILGAE